MEKLYPVLKDYLWGGENLKKLFRRKSDTRIAESWEVSVHPDGESRTKHGTLKQYLREHPEAVSLHGGNLPVLIKYIDADKKLSVQVHPDDGYARHEEGDNGKTEMWYVLSAAEGAGIYCGFKRDTTKEEFIEALGKGEVEALLNFIPVRAGDCYLIEAGTVHAICEGCVILEVQQSSNVTYRVYDYNRRDADGKLRALHVDRALDVMKLGAFEDRTGGGKAEKFGSYSLRLLTRCKYFECYEVVTDGEFHRRNDVSFTAVNAVEGEGTINGEPFAAGDSFFVPCAEEITVKGKAKLILTSGVQE